MPTVLFWTYQPPLYGHRQGQSNTHNEERTTDSTLTVSMVLALSIPQLVLSWFIFVVPQPPR